MNLFINNILSKFKVLNTFDKIIAINIVVFVLFNILRIIPGVSIFTTWFELPKDIFSFVLKPWTIVTYGFLHYDFFHLVMNMLVLYYVIRTLTNLFNLKMILNIYFMGIIFGGLSFLLVYNFPLFNKVKFYGSLIGASAGVRALLIFLCAYMPDTEIKILSFRIKLYYFGLAMVFFDLVGLVGINQGGNVAHLGGALLGYLYAIQLKKGTDIGKGFEGFANWFVGLFKKSDSVSFKKVYKNKSKSSSITDKEDFQDFNKQKKIDLILDKISKSGYDSLTKEEKDFLFRAGR